MRNRLSCVVGNFSKLVLVAAAVSGLAGCSDKNIDQWRQSQVDNAVFKIQGISGTYQGALKSGRDSSLLGNVSIEVMPDTWTQNSSDNLKTELHAGIKGNVHLTGITNAEVAYKQAYYDPDSGNFHLDVQIQKLDGTSGTLQVAGNISGNQLTGSALSEGYPEAGAKFVLTKNGPAADVQSLLSQADGTSDGLFQYQGKLVTDGTGEVAPAELSIEFPTLTAEQRLLNVLDPVRIAGATVEIYPATTRTFRVNFPVVQYDDRTQSLNAQTTAGDGTTKVTVTLSCVKKTISGAQGWTCALSDSGYRTKGDLAPVAPGKPKP